MTQENILLGLASILLLGIGAQYLSWRLNLPAILFLLVFGFIAGPATGFLNPDKLFGDLLLPVVSLLVAIILFEGGLSLKLKEIRGTGRIVFNLLTIGVISTWVLVTFSAYFILRLDIKLSLLLGAILTVTGPTVIGPLLRHIQPKERVNSILKWEGIIIDPIGALLTLLTFEVLFVQGVDQAWIFVALGVLKTAFLATCIGVLAAWVFIFFLARYWLPDHLHGVSVLMLVVGTFTLANHFQSESGLWAVTIMGVALANQRKVSIRHIEEFKETLRILFISSLFVILGARFKLSSLAYFGVNSWIFLGVIIFAARPLSVFFSTRKTNLDWREISFISWMAPRGIVAAAMSSIFAIRLTQLGYSQAEYWESIVFFVIVTTVLVYGITGSTVARALKIANPNPQGVLIVGAHDWARAIARALQEEGIKVLLVDTNRKNIRKAHKDGLSAFSGNVLSEEVYENIDLNGIGYLLALTSNNDANSLMALNFMKLFGRAKVFQIHPDVADGGEDMSPAQHLHGRFLFSHDLNYANFNKKFMSDSKIVSVSLTEELTYPNFLKEKNTKAVPLFFITNKKELFVFSADSDFTPKSGDKVICLLDS
ncbi:MAG: cation:proton antiporter [Phycisphaerae bacterium]|jgi:NhaP-type Na+/H+ or K+/H+ antiporter